MTCVIGNGVVVNLPGFFKELESLDKEKVDYSGRFFISDRAHLLFDLHKIVDGLKEVQLGKDAIGTTKQGIGPCYSHKMQRIGIRVGDLKVFEEVFPAKLRDLVESSRKAYGHFEYDIEGEIAKYREYAKKVAPMIIDTVPYLYNSIKSGKKILVEGANAHMLDIDFGTYPYVTSSNPTVGGIGSGLGIPPQKLSQVIGIVKAYTTRVGSGPFPTEELGATGDSLRKIGHEFGTTTGRPRRCGWLDIVQLRYSHMVNGITDIALTKLDVLSGFPEIKIGTSYILDGKEVDGYPSQIDALQNVKVTYQTLPGWTEDITKVRSYEELPKNARDYVELIEKLLGVHITWIGVGPGREAIVERH